MDLRDAVFALLRQSFGLEEPSAPELSAQQWRDLLVLCRHQAVSGWLYLAVSQFPPDSPVPPDVLEACEADSIRIRERSLKSVNCAAKILDQLRALGLHPVTMKGPAVARYYPRPELRAWGDLDLFLPGDEMGQAVEYFRSKGYLVFLTPDKSWFCHGPILDVDLHDSYYDLHVPAGILPPVPSDEARLLMLSSHILKHAMGPGVGLRQICDLAITYHSRPFDKERLLEAFRVSHTLRWNRMVCSLIKDRLGIDTGLFSRSVSYRSLERIIFSGGNFGHFRKGRQAALTASKPRHRKWDTAMRFLSHLPFALHYAPREFFHYVAALAGGNLQHK